MNWDALQAELTLVPGLTCRRNESMARHTDLRVGGCADLWMVAETKKALEAAAASLKGLGKTLYFFEDGHVLVKDGGLNGAWLRLGALAWGVECLGADGVDVGAAFPVAALHAWREERGLRPIPFLAKRSGTVGQAYKSGLLQGWVGRCTVLRGVRVTELVPEKRRDKQLLIRLRLKEEPSPQTETEGQLRLLPEQIRALGMPGRVLEDPKNDDAAMLIREAGLCGVRLRGARIGQIESNAVVNLGGSSAKDLWLLLQMIRDRVKLHSGVQLQPALRRIGEEK
jgi:UDP-N-acetylenolpyruvoylglucosamine reductase